ncbi:metabotropic glutamate receptor 3-like isoform X1 [Cloeon dipterum]|uniref:metabotropic glutamate receptor 3-like isoform X1 n=1 Tax=Cloeon dipterum TaxID=197152 RepID=UPI0032200281
MRHTGAVLLTLFIGVQVLISASDAGNDTRLLRMNGDIILGGIFPMHEHRGAGHQSLCGAVKEEKGVQRLEAMLYAIDEINKDPDLLPGINLGALVLDSCSSDTYALEQSMEFVRSYMNQDMSEYKCPSGKPPVYVPHKPVTAVIGASFSVVSIMVANILRLFKIPQMSYASTSTELSDKSRFEYFSRVVPPDNFQAQAMVEVVRELGWKYVSTVAVEGDYGEKGIQSFIEIAASSGICIAVSEKILRNAKTEDFDKIVERLVQKANARGVIMFVDEDNTRKLLSATVRANKTGHFTWFGSDSWGAKVHPVKEQEWAAESAITVLPRRTAIEGFDEYYRSLRPRLDREAYTNTTKLAKVGNKLVNSRNIWFREFWSQHHKCSFNDSFSPKCTGNETINDYEQEGLVPYVVDAVYAMAHAIHNLISDVCGSEPFSLCDKLRPAPPGVDLLEYIRNVSFTGRQGFEIKFNKDGDAFGSYNIYQYQRKDDKYDYVKIGTWEERLKMDMSMTKWKNSTVPKSICSENCATGHIRNFQDQCCWVCVACREDAYVFNDTCKPCEPGHAPSQDKTFCVKLPAQVIEWGSPWALVPLAFAVIGILSTIFVLLVFIRYNKTPIIMASGRELCYVLLMGILACYLMTFVILARPTQLSCSILRVGLGVCLTVCYSAIITKTNRISRIFNRGIRSIQRPSCTSPSSQVIICLGIVSVQLLGAIGWLVYEKPDVREVYPYPLTVVLTCGVSTFSLMMSLVYNMFLILLCTLYAFKTRKIPENFNEAKYIGFTMYSTCIVWLAFVPIYFGTNNDYKVQIASTCMCVNISATVALGCLFAPKVYIVLFQPKKNVRQGNTQVRSTRFSASQEDPAPGAAGASKHRPGSSSTYVMRFSGRGAAGCMGMQSSQSAQSMTSGSVSPNKQVNGEPSTLASPSVEESSLS